jgi:hypothetical protein
MKGCSKSLGHTNYKVSAWPSGDVLASELPLRWVIVTDEFGTDPTLRFKQTTVQINALTMISKRVERDETVNLTYLLRVTREQLARPWK